MTKQRKFFGTDGVRGAANREPMTSELSLRLGQAMALHFIRNNRRHGVVIGKDTRLSGYMLETALSSGICSMGGDVLLVGPLPTPGIAYITKSMRAHAGVMISASHNAYHDNGIKLFNRKGYKLDDEVELEIERLMSDASLYTNRPEGDGIGKAVRIDDAAGRYITFLKSTVPPGLTYTGMKIGVDCAHGAGYRVAPAVLSELGAHVVAMRVTPDGKNINSGCGSLHPEGLCQVVKEQGLDCGFALDGDADRVIMCDGEGHVVDGDSILAMCALDMKRKGTLAKDTLVATTMSNLGLELSMKDHGITVVRTGVGDRYVIQAMTDGEYNLGGEQSGHVIFSQHSTTGDGILGALQVLSIMKETGKTLKELRSVIKSIPQIQTSIRVREKKPLEEVSPISILIDEYTKELGSRGRIVVRYSGTEMVARVMVEGEKQDRIRAMASSLAEQITKQLGV